MSEHEAIVRQGYRDRAASAAGGGPSSGRTRPAEDDAGHIAGGYGVSVPAGTVRMKVTGKLPAIKKTAPAPPGTVRSKNQS